MTNVNATPQTSKGNVVTPMPKVTESDVQETAEALGQSGRAWPDAVDGTNGFGDSSADNEEQISTTKVVPKLNPENKSYLAGVIDEIIALEEQRADINAQIQAIKEKAVAKGYNKKGVMAALLYKKMNEDQREGFDLSYRAARESIDLPVVEPQSDWVQDDEKH